jgi:uncharacterized protein YjbI with pentapeptide repeats
MIVDPTVILVIVILTLLVLIGILILVLLVRFGPIPKNVMGYQGYYYQKTIETEGPDSTKRTLEYQPGKTVWDWQQLLVIPLVLFMIAYGFNLLQNAHSEQLATDQQQQTDLNTYIDHMSDLLLNDKLHDSKLSRDEVRRVARARTLIVLTRLDPQRKKFVVQFLFETHLIDQRSSANPSYPIVTLDYADLNNVDLSGMYLENADLFDIDIKNANLNNAYMVGVDISKSLLNGSTLIKTNLYKANLYLDILQGANLSGANLSNANLTSTDLSGANLQGANLSGANLQGANLHGANFSGAIMPNGEKHP